MWEKKELVEAVHDHPLEVAEALAAVQVGDEPRLTLDSLAVPARLKHLDPAELLVDALERRQHLRRFGAALQSLGVPLDPLDQPFVDHVDLAGFSLFGPRAQAFRCRVFVNDEPAGSGCLIGPSTVLTAWHVIAVKPPSGPQEPAPNIRVALADATTQEVVVPPRFSSMCGDSEYDGIAPTADDDVRDRNDVAVLVMRRPAAAHLGHVGLPAEPPETADHGAVLLIHFPDGADQGVGLGELAEIPRVTARWRHTVTTQPGSSGGPCFDRNLQLTGLHQGKWQGGGRLVPVARFVSDLRPLVAADLAPTSLWSLDGTDTGPLVLGRDLFFEAVAAAGDAAGRIRGLRIKRVRIADGTTGLAFSHHLLVRVLARRGADHTVVRVGFDTLVTDLVDDVHRRSVAAGLPVADLPAAANPRPASPEQEARERTRLLAAALEQAAATAGRTVWLFFDSPSVALTEPARLLLDGFVAAALLQPHLRLVVSGFETVALPGQEFPTPEAAGGPGPPGLVVEFVGGFTRRAVLDFLARAHVDLVGVEPNPVALDTIADRVLARLDGQNGTYPASALEPVSTALRDDLYAWSKKGRA